MKMGRFIYFFLQLALVLSSYEHSIETREEDPTAITVRIEQRSPPSSSLSGFMSKASSAVAAAICATLALVPSGVNGAIGWLGRRLLTAKTSEVFSEFHGGCLTEHIPEKMLKVMNSIIAEFNHQREEIRLKGAKGGNTDYSVIKYSRMRMDPERVLSEIRAAIGDNLFASIETVKSPLLVSKELGIMRTYKDFFRRSPFSPPGLTNPNWACGAIAALQAMMANDILPYIEEPLSKEISTLKRFKTSWDALDTPVQRSSEVFNTLGGSWRQLRVVGLPTVNIRELMTTFPSLGEASESVVDIDGLLRTERIISLVALKPKSSLNNLIAENHISFYNLPKFLVIQLIKLPDNVQVIPCSLFVKAPTDDFIVKTVTGIERTYELRAVVDFHLNDSTGHWTAKVRKENTWFDMDDTYSETLESSDVVTENAFLLVYQAT